MNIQPNVHNIHIKEICITHKKMDFLFLVNILYRQLHMEVNCVLLSAHTFILHLYMILSHFIQMMVQHEGHTFPLLLSLD